ncbi:hypothetical protein [Myroides sp. N17-2]|uniref:hypothetical protein n=1 Tax=Myroides sp. N17-2 TaxID=2030799 RepID=UPI00156EFED6|nr:hypothetical protein [Myroides sp. N17-2]
MRKILFFMLVIALVSCAKEEITPVADTQIEGLKGKVKSQVTTSSNSFFGLAGKHVTTYDEQGYKVSEELLIDESKTGEYTLLAKVEYVPYLNNSRSSKTYGADHKLYNMTTTKWLTNQSYSVVLENVKDKNFINIEEVSIDDKGGQVYIESRNEYVDKSQENTKVRTKFLYDDRGYKISEKQSFNDDPYREVKVINLAFDKQGNITKQKMVSDEVDANYEVEYIYEYY